MSAPKRVQMSRQRPWRADNPDAVIVARPSKWGNPYRRGHAQMRFPCADGRQEWEHEGRLHKTSGERHAFHHGDFTLREDGSKQYRVTWHDVRDATVAECVVLYRHHLTHWRPDLIDEARNELAGRDLACWCPLDQPCHADVLLEIANGGAA